MRGSMLRGIPGVKASLRAGMLGGRSVGDAGIHSVVVTVEWEFASAQRDEDGG